MMQQWIKRLFRIGFVFCAVLIVVVSYALSTTEPTSAPAAQPYLLIDPGHGGMDGGATAADGTLEKTLNLSIATNLRDLLHILGVSIKMTREQDVSIHDEGCTTTRQKKVSDMNNRLALYEGSQATISIHQNHFSVSKYRGAQVYYSVSHPVSAQLAQSVQQSIQTSLQLDNQRKPAKATDSIFLLHRTKKPAIIVECGFLSNPQDCSNLNNTSYQQKMALTIAVGVLDVYHQ